MLPDFNRGKCDTFHRGDGERPPRDTQTGNLHGVVLCHQLKAVDLIARGAKFHTVADEKLISEVISKLVNLIDPQ